MMRTFLYEVIVQFRLKTVACLQDAVPESQPQAVPYAAAVADLELPEHAGAVDQGIEHGLATAAATDQADVAYTLHAEGPAALEAPQPPESAAKTSETLQDVESLSAAPAGAADDSEVCTCSLKLECNYCDCGISSSYIEPICCHAHCCNLSIWHCARH